MTLRSKILLSICTIFCLAVSSHAGRYDYLRGVGGGSYSADDCSGTLVFSWHANLDDSTPNVTDGCPSLPCGCADTDETGTAENSPTFSNAYGGGYALYIDAKDEHFIFLETGANFEDIKITFDIYVVSFPGVGKDTSFIKINSVGTDSIILYSAGTSSINGQRYCDSEMDTVTVSSLNTGQWYNDCEYLAKNGVAGNDHKLTIGGETPVEEDDDLKASVNADNAIKVGEDAGDKASTYLIRNVKVYSASGY